MRHAVGDADVRADGRCFVTVLPKSPRVATSGTAHRPLPLACLVLMPVMDVGPVAVDVVRSLVGVLMAVGLFDRLGMRVEVMKIAMRVGMKVHQAFVPVGVSMFFCDDEPDADDHQ